MKTLSNILIYSVFLNFFLLSGCTQIVGNEANKMINPSSKNLSTESTNTLVDCKLPAQLRKLGRSMTYLTDGETVKISLSECKIRGGISSLDKNFASVK